MNKQSLLLGLFLFSLAFACQQKKDYESIKAKALASGERYDSLFLNMYFQMHSKDFYNRCWELNKQGILADGNGNATARYRLETELDYPADFEFYPVFRDHKIAIMTAFAEYDGWAPWNKHLAADKLIEDVKDLFEEWYDIKFLPIVSPSKLGKAYLNISGNRKIVLHYNNDDKVLIEYWDLTIEDKIPNVLL